MSIQTQPSQLQKLKIIENVQARKIIENGAQNNWEWLQNNW